MTAHSTHAYPRALAAISRGATWNYAYSNRYDSLRPESDLDTAALLRRGARISAAVPEILAVQCALLQASARAR